MSGWGEPRTKTVSWHDPAIARAAASTMQGREFLQAIIDGRLPRPAFAALTGAELVAVDDGVAVFRFTPDESTLNPLGIVHGGLVCTLLDSAAGCAVQTQLPAGVGISSIEIKVSFLSPANGATLEVEGRALRVGRQVAFAEATPGPPAASWSGTQRRQSRWRARLNANNAALAGRRGASAAKAALSASESPLTVGGAASGELFGVLGESGSRPDALSHVPAPDSPSTSLAAPPGCCVGADIPPRLGGSERRRRIECALIVTSGRNARHG